MLLIKTRDFSAVGVSYAVSDDVSVSLNSSSVEYEQTTLDDQEATGVSASYTSRWNDNFSSNVNIDNVAGTGQLITRDTKLTSHLHSN